MSVATPDDRRYGDGDLWARREGETIRVGITDFAQDQLGEIVYVDVPAVGDQVTAGQSMGEVESAKTVSELLSPVTGKVVEGNDELEDQPDLLNSSPYEDGWIARLEPDDPDQVGSLMTADEYDQHRS